MSNYATEIRDIAFIISVGSIGYSFGELLGMGLAVIVALLISEAGNRGSR